MNIILLSGGSGKRLWPLSNDIRSKQFIKLFKNANGEHQSMVQRVYGQIKSVIPDATVTIATSKSQVSSILNQLGEQVGISAEPCRRDTFPAIVLAAAYLADVRKVALTEPVVVCPVDPYVEEDYFRALKDLSDQAAKGEASLVLMGIEPTYPSEKYGYILPQNADKISGVNTFKEKPDAATAESYIRRGALWNGGIFAFRLGYLLTRAHELIQFKDYGDLLAKYAELPKISFDYAVVEKESSIQVIRFGGQWKDLGTWNTFTEAMDEPSLGNAILNDTCENVHVVNELDMPVLAMGLKDVVISASPEGILVSDKEQSSYIKPFVEGISQQVMFAEKSWGSYRVLHVGESSLTILVTLKPSHSMNYHNHQRRDEVWVVLAGHGHVLVDDVWQNIKVGDTLKLPVGCRHMVYADTELQLVEVQLGEDISVQDKVKHDIKPDTSAFGSNDIRGIYPETINEEIAYRIGRHFPQIFQAKKVAVGRDVRLSGGALQRALVRGLTESGCDVVDIGQCGTEMIYFATFHRELDGGIMITASHNPREYNGMKFVGRGAVPISNDNGLVSLREAVAGSKLPLAAGQRGDAVSADIMGEYVNHLLSYIDVTQLRPYKIVVNSGSGTAGLVVDALEKYLPFELVKVHHEPDGNFPYGVPNPMLNENREETSRAVREHGADLGVAWDGDFDRCFLFDENGMMIEGYYMVGLLAEAFLQKCKGAKILHDPRAYWNTQEICRIGGGEAIICKVGHAFIKAKMREEDAVYGGEMSSHHYFRDFAYCDSGMIPWLLVAELLSKSGGRRLSELLAERMARYPVSGEINTKVADAEAVLQRMEGVYGTQGTVSKIDGLSVDLGTWRFNLRKSNTEPLIRLNVETRGDRQLLKEKTAELLEQIRS